MGMSRRIEPTPNPVRVERSRDAHRRGARPMGVSTSLDTNGMQRASYPAVKFLLVPLAAPLIVLGLPPFIFPRAPPPLAPWLLPRPSGPVQQTTPVQRRRPPISRGGHGP